MMKKWTTVLAWVMAMVLCFPGALAEQDAATEPAVYAPGKVTFGLLADALASDSGKMLVAQVRGAGIPLEEEMPDLLLRLGAGLMQQGARLELGLRESQQSVGFDVILDVDAQGIAIESDLLPNERYTMLWETLLGMDLTELANQSGTLEAQMEQVAALAGALEPILEPYIATVDSFMQELATEEYYDVPEEHDVAPMAYEIYTLCTHAQAADLLTQLADQLASDEQMTALLDAMLASEELSTADLVNMMQSAAEPLAQSEGYYLLGAGTNYDMAAKPWFVTLVNMHADGASDNYYLGLETDDEDNTLYYNLGYLQMFADESYGNGVDLIVGIMPDAQDPRAMDWLARLTVAEGEAETAKLEIGSNNEAMTTQEGLPGYENSLYVGVGLPEITTEYKHVMNRFMTADGGEAFELDAILWPDMAQEEETYAVTLKANIAPGADGVQGEGSLMIGTVEMPELTGLSFELYEAEPLQFEGESTVVALDTLSEAQLNDLGERMLAALTQCLDAMPVQQAGE